MKLQPTTTTYDTPPNFLANQHFVALPEGITIDYTTVPTAEDGSRVVEAGTAIGKITASGLYGPYDDGVSDGREVGVGLTFYESDVTEGNDTNSLVIHGIIKEGALPAESGVDAAFKVDANGLIFV
jgi:hypothetical protein